mmetsp:Transcript_28793/g.73928  ORF Transcript_28793/g.73928 Transcript_28793/m.73928 type:complete len:90 (+) Transcript_28793:144-413(+)|eukprot:CAMPEP_0115852342 /NCGR_PEP_ID=MMETSP0287-20121206/12947_1 /TAXON_ID=412157 /ORGANISM="Chrysochromulina rotalis, Strain UIO044" /LENGTH=89 /DNA_ID=CAMNT_0003306401 /DNA_START=54 /DNA_END=323 /DNA_ORIENTATION=-
MSEELVLNTAPTSKRFPTTNQSKACYMYYNSWHQCKYDYSEEEPQCAKLKGWAMSMCPIEWVEKWEAQRASGTYPGPVPGEKKDPGEGH